MALVLHPLFGLSCSGEMLPDPNDRDIERAFDASQILAMAMEKAPAPEMGPDPSAPGQAPERALTNELENTYTPGFGRR